ncbi:hypothetical protein QP426_08300, partial [Pauljensenia sp. UMB1235]|uniref:hypothetical protein n=1 Tax=unclassified Pauljensenia TaxID=2908895 RepID=UPI00254A0F9C
STFVSYLSEGGSRFKLSSLSATGKQFTHLHSDPSNHFDVSVTTLGAKAHFRPKFSHFDGLNTDSLF